MAARIEPPAPNPFTSGARAFADTRAQAYVAARNWQLFAWGCLIVAVGAIALAWDARMQPRELPYVVTYNDQQGEIQNLGLASPLTQDQHAEVVITQYALRQFVTYWRSVLPTAAFQTRVINEYVSPLLGADNAASTLVSNFYAAANPYKLLERETVEVTAQQPVPETPTTYAIDWTETTRDLIGHVIGTTGWHGFLTFTYSTPDANIAKLNPAGITLTNISAQATESPRP